MVTQSRSEHVLELGRELLDDIELRRTTAEGLIVKATRLARWVGSDEIRYWLPLEMGGYNNTSPISKNTWTSPDDGPTARKSKVIWGHWQNTARIIAEKAKLASMRIPDSSSDAR
jgi:AbiTii